MKLVHGVIAAAAILSAVPSFAQTAAPAAAPVAAAPEVTAPVAAPATAMSAAPAQKAKVICRREVEIGSLVKGTRRCATVTEWRKSADAAREQTMRIQDQKGAFTGN